MANLPCAMVFFYYYLLLFYWPEKSWLQKRRDGLIDVQATLEDARVVVMMMYIGIIRVLGKC